MAVQLRADLLLLTEFMMVQLVQFACPWLFLPGIGQQVVLIPPHVSAYKPDRQLADMGFYGEGIARDVSC